MIQELRQASPSLRSNVLGSILLNASPLPAHFRCRSGKTRSSTASGPSSPGDRPRLPRPGADRSPEVRRATLGGRPQASVHAAAAAAARPVAPVQPHHQAKDRAVCRSGLSRASPGP